MCWRFHEKVESYQILEVITKGEQAFVLYKVRLYTGLEFQNVEFVQFEKYKIIRIQVFYGALPSGL